MPLHKKMYCQSLVYEDSHNCYCGSYFLWLSAVLIFDYGTRLAPLNTRLVRYLDPQCTINEF